MKIYSLCDIVDDYCAVGVPVVHGCERFVTFLTCRVPYFEFDRCGIIKSDGLGKESGADGGFPVIIKLILWRTL